MNPTFHPIVITRLENGDLYATGQCSANPLDPTCGGASFLSIAGGWNGVFAQMAMASPQAEALKPGQSATFDPNQNRWIVQP